MGGVLLLEICLFFPSYFKFFCGDSLYFLSRRDGGWQLFTQLDSFHTYRPLTHAIFDYLMYPLSGLDPRGYHLMTLGVLLLTTLVVWLLLKRVTRSPAAALAGLFFFGMHPVNFFLSYDATFLPDFSMGLFAAGSLLAYAGESSILSLLLYGAALCSKESAVMLPAGLAAVELLVSGRDREPKWSRLVPFAILTGGYLLFQFYLRGVAFYPSGNSAYRLSFRPGDLFLKLKYLPWIAGLPANAAGEGLGWTLVESAVLLPALLWIAARLRAGWRQEPRTFLYCGAWMIAALLPVLAVVQVPMMHNVHLPVIALAIVLARCVDLDPHALERGTIWLMASLLLSSSLQVHNKLRFSWVGEGSDVTERSLRAVKRAYPQLPRGAVLYVEQATKAGNIAWYFDGGALFRLFYNDPSLEMFFPNSPQALTPEFFHRKSAIVFRFYNDRLYDVTRDYALWASGRESASLAVRLDNSELSNHLTWTSADLSHGNTAWYTELSRGDALRRALVMLPGTRLRFPVTNLPQGARLNLGITTGSDRSGGGLARISFESNEPPRVLFSMLTDSRLDSNTWWDQQLDLSPCAGRSGALVLENDSDPPGDSVAWSGLQVVLNPARDQSLFEAAHGRPVRERGLGLLDQFDNALVSFDRSEVYPDYSKFETPTGRPVFLFWETQATPRRVALVTIAGARAKFSVPALPAHAALHVAVSHGTGLGDGIRGKIFWETQLGGSGSRELIFDRMVQPRMKNWNDAAIPLDRWAGQGGVLSMEASSGPGHNTVGDWLAWSRLRIVRTP